MSDDRFRYSDPYQAPLLDEEKVGTIAYRDHFRESTRTGLARAMQAFALGYIFEDVGKHYLEAADRALEVLLPGTLDEYIESRKKVGISRPFIDAPPTEEPHP